MKPEMKVCYHVETVKNGFYVTFKVFKTEAAARKECARISKWVSARVNEVTYLDGKLSCMAEIRFGGAL